MQHCLKMRTTMDQAWSSKMNMEWWSRPCAKKGEEESTLTKQKWFFFFLSGEGGYLWGSGAMPLRLEVAPLECTHMRGRGWSQLCQASGAQAEVLTALKRVKLAKSLGLRSIILEDDARFVFEEFESSLMDPFYNGTQIHQIYFLGLSFEKFRAQIIPRNCNMVTNFLAYLAKFQMSKVWLEEVPNCILELITQDLSFK